MLTVRDVTEGRYETLKVPVFFSNVITRGGFYTFDSHHPGNEASR